jgi:hypothetical protein
MEEKGLVMNNYENLLEDIFLINMIINVLNVDGMKLMNLQD